MRDRIAEEFENEKTFSGKLAANSSAWESYKANAGLDTRRGHAYGRLQAMIDRSRLWNVRPQRTKIVVEFSDNRLLSLGYAGFYIASKVKGAALAGIRPSWLKPYERAVATLGVARRSDRPRQAPESARPSERRSPLIRRIPFGTEVRV
jgi:hypothetical protein